MKYALKNVEFGKYLIYCFTEKRELLRHVNFEYICIKQCHSYGVVSTCFSNRTTGWRERQLPQLPYQDGESFFILC